MDKILTAEEWADKNIGLSFAPILHIAMQEYADYYAREMAIKFHLWSENLTDEQVNEMPHMHSIQDYYDQFINDQKKK